MHCKLNTDLNFNYGLTPVLGREASLTEYRFDQSDASQSVSHGQGKFPTVEAGAEE